MGERIIFDEAFRARLHELFIWRRDVRRFRRDALPAGALDRLIETACLGPSVGLSQPWRFVTVDDPLRRAAVIEAFRAANAEALAAYSGERAERYARLKLAGLAEAPGHLALFTDRSTEVGHGLGRRSMPETAEYSAVAAITIMWLAARAEGIGMGWVSILDPARVAAILEVPADWRFIGYFCLGYPESEEDRPELERAGWAERRGAREFILRR
ncbi:MAG TPA: 5,6-dimethylbenzimidazole synthase [Stellaceae bacterium]|nr:5,6-dimethylbenzimidazole synthase [Stellaceae bacterium]